MPLGRWTVLSLPRTVSKRSRAAIRVVGEPGQETLRNGHLGASTKRAAQTASRPVRACTPHAPGNEEAWPSEPNSDLVSRTTTCRKQARKELIRHCLCTGMGWMGVPPSGVIASLYRLMSRSPTVGTAAGFSTPPQLWTRSRCNRAEISARLRNGSPAGRPLEGGRRGIDSPKGHLQRWIS